MRIRKLLFTLLTAAALVGGTPGVAWAGGAGDQAPVAATTTSLR